LKPILSIWKSEPILSISNPRVPHRYTRTIATLWPNLGVTRVELVTYATDSLHAAHTRKSRHARMELRQSWDYCKHVGGRVTRTRGPSDACPRGPSHAGAGLTRIQHRVDPTAPRHDYQRSAHRAERNLSPVAVHADLLAHPTVLYSRPQASSGTYCHRGQPPIVTPS
jgi:hypothetical protein